MNAAQDRVHVRTSCTLEFTGSPARVNGGTLTVDLAPKCSTYTVSLLIVLAVLLTLAAVLYLALGLMYLRLTLISADAAPYSFMAKTNLTAATRTPVHRAGRYSQEDGKRPMVYSWVNKETLYSLP